MSQRTHDGLGPPPGTSVLAEPSLPVSGAWSHCPEEIGAHLPPGPERARSLRAAGKRAWLSGTESGTAGKLPAGRPTTERERLGEKTVPSRDLTEALCPRGHRPREGSRDCGPSPGREVGRGVGRPHLGVSGRKQRLVNPDGSRPSNTVREDTCFKAEKVRPCKPRATEPLQLPPDSRCTAGQEGDLAAPATLASGPSLSSPRTLPARKAHTVSTILKDEGEQSHPWSLY